MSNFWKKATKALKSTAGAIGLDSIIPGLGSASAVAGAVAAPELPDITAAPLAPTGADPAVAEAERREREAQLRARGRQSTIATSGQGDLSTPNLAKRKLLGA